MTVEEVELLYQLDRGALADYQYLGVIPKLNLEQRTRTIAEDDCKWIGLVKHMRRSGVSMDILREYECLRERGAATLAEQKTLMTQQREWMEEQIAYMQQTLECLDCWIEQM